MKIVELSDYSVIIMKDSEDPFYFSLSGYAVKARKEEYHIGMYKNNAMSPTLMQISNDFVCTAGRLVLLFGDKVKDCFQKGDTVRLFYSRV